MSTSSRWMATMTLASTLILSLSACTDGNGAAQPADDGENSGTGAADGGESRATDEVGEPALDLVADDLLTVCTEGSYPPFAYEDEQSPSGYSGFDIELLSEVASRLGLDGVEVVEAGFEEIVSGAVFEDARCDVGSSAIAVTEARAERLTFSQPYYVSRRALLVRSGSQIEELQDLERGMVLGVQAGTAAADRAAEDAGDVEIRSFDDGDELHGAFVSGDLDAVLHDHAVVQVWAAQDDGLRVTEEFRRVDELAFAVAREREDQLGQQLDRGLEALRDDGTYDELFERFFGVER